MGSAGAPRLGGTGLSVETTRHYRTSRWLAAGVFAVAAVGVPQSAHANNLVGTNYSTGCSGGVHRDDGGTHTFQYESTGVNVTSMENWTRTNVYDPTDLVTSFYTGSSTDVIVRDQDYTTYCGYTWHGSGGTVYGLYVCEAATGSGRCERSSIRYDLSYVNATTEANRRGLACHETGHSLGLAHYNTYSGCMETSGPYFWNISEHDRSHINATH